MITNIIRLALALVCVCNVVANVYGTIANGTRADWDTVKTISATMHGQFYQALFGDNSQLIFEAKLNKLEAKVFTLGSHELLVYKTAVAKEASSLCAPFVGYMSDEVVGYIIYTSKGDKLWITACAYLDTVTSTQFKDAFIEFLSKQEITFNKVYGVLPKLSGEAFESYQRRLLSLGFTQTDNPEALEYCDEDEKAMVQGFEMLLEDITDSSDEEDL